MAAIVLSTLTACSGPSQPVETAATRTGVAVSTRAARPGISAGIQAMVAGRDLSLGVFHEMEREELRALYSQKEAAPLWLDEAGWLTPASRDALDLLRHAADDGLEPDAYYRETLTRLTDLFATGSRAEEDLARFDLALSAAMLRYVRHLHMGRVDPRAIGFRLDVPRDRHDFADWLRSAIAEDRVSSSVAEFRPSLAQYRLLRDMLKRYRQLERDPTFVVPPPPSSTVRPGEFDAGSADLRRVLIALGDLPAGAPVSPAIDRVDDALADGVRRFQRRHGLEPTGTIGPSTLAALRVPLRWRVRQIELALERLRWLPHVGDKRLIALNIPMFRLWAWDEVPPDGMPLFGMDVIVGRALNTETPVFVEDMREVIVRPSWNVPPSILRDELLPMIERDPDYLDREGMEIVRGVNDAASSVALTADALDGLRQGALRVRQRPGAANALGLIKFVFPNEESVYMHGTPAQELFARNRRDFSHGCVRVADPVALAAWVLQDDPAWTRDRIFAATTGTETIRIALPRPIQVILFYVTAAVMPEDGTLWFSEDIYRQDVKLDRALRTPL